MAKPNSDRNLLVGILALQLSLVSEQQLLNAVKAWAFDKSKLLEDLFLEQNAIDESSRSMLYGLVARTIGDENPKTSSEVVNDSLPTVLAALEKLSSIDDSDVRDSVTDFLTKDRHLAIESPTKPFEVEERGRRFRIISLVDEGGLGRVSLAEDLELHREVALKEILPQYLHSEETRHRFLLEAEVTGRLEHPSIVPVYSLGTSDNGGPFYAMQLIRGTSLAKAIRALHFEQPKLDPNAKRQEVRKLIGRLIDACQAVQYAHSKRVLHRDLKPQNIMLGKFGETFVVDWGLARVHKTDPIFLKMQTEESVLIPSGSGSTATRLGSMIGTVHYMSPEQADGLLDEMGAASDVFSLGATLYCILTGSPPKSLNPEHDNRRLDYGNFAKPSQINHEVSGAIDAICMKALASKVSERYQSAAELVDDLEAWLADEPVSAYRESFADRARRWLKQHQTLATSAVVALSTSLVGLVAWLALLSIYNQNLSQARDEAVQNESVARRLLSEELRIDQELLGRNELTAVEIAQFRLRLVEGAYQQHERWFKRNPDDRNLRAEFAFVARALSNLNRSISRFKNAQSCIQASLDAQNAIALAQKTQQEKYDFALTKRDYSDLELLDGRLGNALLAVDEAQQILKSIAPDDTYRDGSTATYAGVTLLRARILHECGRYDEALSDVDQASNSQSSLRGGSMSSPDVSVAQAVALRVRILDESGQRMQALPIADQAISEMRLLVSGAKREIVNSYVSLLNSAAKMRIDQGSELQQAASLVDECVRLLDSQFKKDKAATLSVCYVDAQRMRSILFRLQGDLPAAQIAIQAAKNECEALTSRLATFENLIAQADTELERYEIFKALEDIKNREQSLTSATALLQTAHRQAPDCLRIKSKLNRLEQLKNK